MIVCCLGLCFLLEGRFFIFYSHLFAMQKQHYSTKGTSWDKYTVEATSGEGGNDNTIKRKSPLGSFP